MQIKIKLVSELREYHHSSPSPSVIDYAEEIMGATRGYKYCVTGEHEAWVYREGDTYAMGKITYADVTDSRLSHYTYNVISPNIVNNKYSHGWRQHLASSVNLKKAVKNATRYLRPLSMKHVVELSGKGARQKAIEAVEAARNQVHNTAGELTRELFSTRKTSHDNKLQRELRRMVDAGYEFLDAEFGAQLKAAFTALDELKQSRETNTDIYTIVDAFTSVTGKQMFRLIRDQELSWYTPDIDPNRIETYEQSDLPEDIAGKLAVLSMTADDTYVEGVGYRAAPTLYYIR
jgi:hypothetical protein